MASLDDIEGGAAEVTGGLLAVVLIAVAIYLFLKWKAASLPVSLYPYSIWSRFASFIDGLFYESPLRGGKIQASTDNVLGGVGSWLVDHTPNPASSPNWASYANQFQDLNQASLDTGTSS